TWLASSSLAGTSIAFSKRSVAIIAITPKTLENTDRAPKSSGEYIRDSTGTLKKTNTWPVIERVANTATDRAKWGIIASLRLTLRNRVTTFLTAAKDLLAVTGIRIGGVEADGPAPSAPSPGPGEGGTANFYGDAAITIRSNIYGSLHRHAASKGA